MAQTRTAKLAVMLGGGDPPTEFRLFVAGWNETENGRYLFDAQAAAEVLAAYQAHGVDRMIDLEHLSLEDPRTSLAFDPDARGWCKLELRPDGSLWAVGVTWTPDGAARLTDKRQRYVSPAFLFDSETRRVTQILNVAITAMPATHQTPALVAASRRAAAKLAAGARGMDPTQVKAALDALIAGDTKACMDMLAQIIASAAGAEGAEVEQTDPMAMDKAAPVEPAPDMAAARTLIRLSGKPSAAEAVDEITTWRESHLALERDRAKLAQDRAALESAERRALVGRLVTECGEAPATAWADDSATKPAEPWASMALSALRARVAKLSGKAPKAPTPPTTESDEHGLTPEQIAICKDTNCDPKTFAALRARLRGAAS